MKNMMDFIVSVFPIVILIYWMTKKNGIPSHRALPYAALLFYFIKLVYFKDSPNLVNANLLSGLLTAWTPILIIWGAVLLFKTMENSGGMDTVRNWLDGISGNPVAQLMIIGWAFSFLIEGASGFGTPAALAAPLLVGLGFDPVKAAILCLIMNSVPVSFGAVGTPTWFGLGNLGLTEGDFSAISLKTALFHFAAAMVIPVIALRFVLTWEKIKKNLGFVYISILSCMVPYLLCSFFSSEFPSLLGGFIGLIASVIFAEKGIGLEKSAKKTDAKNVDISALVKAMFPLWGSILVLVVTRIPCLQLKGFLTSPEHSLRLSLGTLGELKISPCLSASLGNIFGTDVGWQHHFLYVPSIVPFFLVSFISFFLFRMERVRIYEVWLESYQRMKMPILALTGALVFVKLLMSGGDASPAVLIGKDLAKISGGSWQFFASYLGALGAFFAGSNTISNLTFGAIQKSIAIKENLNVTTILSLQSVGGAMGNMVCINNIVAVCSLLGLVAREGYIIKRTVIPMLIYGLIVGFLSLFF